MSAEKPPLRKGSLGQSCSIFGQCWGPESVFSTGGCKIIHDLFGELGSQRVRGFWALIVLDVTERFNAEIALFDLGREVLVAGS